MPEHGSRSNSNKRRRTTGMYQRRRAVAACQLCRLRKTKCDNVRPACGFCEKHGARCVYGESSGGGGDYSTFDPASLAILDRINDVVALLEARPPAGTPTDNTPVDVDGGGIDCPDAADQLREDEILPPHDSPEFPAACTNCESILRWPVFTGFAPDIQSFVLQSESDEDGDDNDCSSNYRPSNYGRGVQEDDFVPLSKKFLAYVHVKNPILDVADFRAHVREAVEAGPRWNGPSCLVLIACALACVSSPFNPDLQRDGSPESTHSSSMVSTVDKDTAEAYYLAARKRLGLLRPSLIQVQCLFFCGVFEMFSFRPLRAWFNFHQASQLLQTHLWRRSLRQPVQETTTAHHRSRRLEQRLYWSCMKSECELRHEIPLPPSGITRFVYPDSFPSPPTELASSTAAQQQNHEFTADIEPEEERSWLYYFAEISFRKMMNRIVAVMCRGGGEQGWISNIQQTMNQCETFNEEIDLWCSHIPPPINRNNSEVANNELAYFVHGRALSARSFIHRPFLYYIIHQPPDDPYVPLVMPLAKKCLQTCEQVVLHSYPHHRHHGTWYVSRAAVTNALLLLAAARSRKIEPADRWRETVDLCVLLLQRWSGESPDLQWAASLLDDIVRDTYAMLFLSEPAPHS